MVIFCACKEICRSVPKINNFLAQWTKSDLCCNENASKRLFLVNLWANMLISIYFINLVLILFSLIFETKIGPKTAECSQQKIMEYQLMLLSIQRIITVTNLFVFKCTHIQFITLLNAKRSQCFCSV